MKGKVPDSGPGEVPVRFTKEAKKRSGQDIDLCYQCLKCTAGCPVSPYMDIRPNSIIRLLQLGREDEVLESSALWMCVSCGTCGTRCPNKIDIASLLDTVREMAIERKVHAREKNIHILHDSFVRSIGRGGRVHEASMLIDYKLRSRDFLTDMLSGMKLFLKGKIPVLPDLIKGREEIKRIYEKCQK